jgi:thiol-disulfide isomerase/thioredoxin
MMNTSSSMNYYSFAASVVLLSATAAAWVSTRPPKSRPHRPVLDANALVDAFPSLATCTAPIVGFYFCASWCPDCILATRAVHNVALAAKELDEPVIDIVYVSSDMDEESMARYKPGVFKEISFEQKDERDALKRHFGVCAMKEMRALKMNSYERRHGIPTLILLDSSTGRIITEEGVENCVSGSPMEVLEAWMKMVDEDDQQDMGESIRSLINL